MATRTLSKSEATRERILDATAEVLNTKGYAGTRLSDIAEVAGVQPTAVYYYFDSRDLVIGEAVQEGLRRVLASVQEALAALPAGASPMDRISAAVAAHLQATLRDSKYGAVAIRLASSLPPAIREAQLVDERRYGVIWRTLIADADRAGQINSALDAPAARMLILGALNWAAEWWNPSRGSLTRTIATAQLMVRQGLSAPSEES
ncbi:TetR/AcrR family transcriptional regulator [Sporichthya sp.]|uniref:TetR/AcrR family transcriptional regulator n=1 Tax=Sporichthya sp. TaxID=65475 RepID=UPI0017B74547|nr:TetR family transcriptional regulator [Sporichthya sp.]MBA3741881.1 TetR/AcrR family transcriptional regulator [Sporichthya sp.]